ncbi:MAG: ATP synthase F1 subunit gamma, partial [Anaerolinea sp.]|nr:ATP synthase F1 subunit gamma [Anaerolinea sp.]
RIRSVKNIGQITRALEAVSASRVRRAQARVLASRAFAEKAWEILLNVQSTSRGTALHPLLTPPPAELKSALIILITSDRGLAGAFNTNIIRVAHRFAGRIPQTQVKYITVGRKGRDALIRLHEPVIAEFSNPAEPTIAHINPIVRLATDEFLSGRVDEVFVAYTDFINTLTQRPTVLRLLPLVPYETDDQVAAEYIKGAPKVTTGKLDYEYEPNAQAILDEIVPRFTALQLYQAVLESQASEHSARMVAMRNASDNASGLVEDLTLVYNKARQAGITAEILDIVGGAEALQASLDKATHTIEDLLAAAAAVNAVPEPKKPKTASAKAKPRATSAAVAGAAAVAELVAEDDLTVIEGIGPKISAILKAAGIATYADLAAATEERLREILSTAGLRLAPSLPTWPRQAAIAARGAWDELKALQGQLTAGREN